MHIEVFPGRNAVTGSWFWHFKNKGRITGDAEAFPTKAHAIRVAKAVVTATLKEVGVKPLFTVETIDNVAHIVWERYGA